MAEKYFDLDALAVQLNVECVETASPVDGSVTRRYMWKHEELPAACAAARAAAREGEELCFKGGAMSWLLGAVIAQLLPVLTAFEMDGEKKPVYALPMGGYSPEGGATFEVEERGGNTYIAYQCDDPSKPSVSGPHNYDLDKLGQVVLPELSPETKLYLKPQSYFYILAVFLKSWGGRCESIWIWDDMAQVYVCAYSQDITQMGCTDSQEIK